MISFIIETSYSSCIPIFKTFFSIHTQFSLNVLSLQLLYAYPTADQYHVGTNCQINQRKNGGTIYERNQKHKNHRRRSWLRQH